MPRLSAAPPAVVPCHREMVGATVSARSGCDAISYYLNLTLTVPPPATRPRRPAGALVNSQVNRNGGLFHPHPAGFLASAACPPGSTVSG